MVDQAIVVVHTTDANLAYELSDQAAACQISVEFTEDFDQLHKTLTEHSLDALVIDLRSAQSDPHTLSQQLEVFQNQSAGKMAVLLGQVHSEVIERTLITQQIPQYHSVEELTSDYFKQIAAAKTATQQPEAALETPNAAPVNYSPDRQSGAVLRGITRSFETNTPAMRRMLLDLEIAATHDVTILLIGETGAGKTFLSSLIHEVSQRRNEPFLPVACGALPNELIESELFGHVKGAFTSAHADKEGKFVAAQNGTILLDEIDVLGPEQQVKLLRVIETGQFEPVGSNRTMKSNARLIVASNLNLEPLVEQGKFRPDLYYRLNMLKFELLPLRKRKPDIAPLAKKFIRQLSEKHGVRINRVEESLIRKLYEYPWPGNVRELENVIQRAVIYCRDGILSEAHLPDYVRHGVVGPANDASIQLRSQAQNVSPETLEQHVALTEQEMIELALANHGQSRTKAAKELGISRVTLYNKMKKYGMQTHKAKED